MIYLAGPFFNRIQVNHAMRMIALCKENGISYYAPIEHQEPDFGTPNMVKIFQDNIIGLLDSSIVLAQLDYPLPANWRLLAHKIGTYPQDVSLPDVGTVWEMGFAFAKGKSIVGYWLTEPVSKVNLMLAKCCIGILSGIINVAKFLTTNKHGALNWTAVIDYKGEMK